MRRMASETPPGLQEASAEGRRFGGIALLAVARFELLRHLRRRRFVILLIIAALMVSLLVVVLQVFGSASGDAYAYVSSYGTWVTILVALAATFFGADAIVGEFEHRTGYLILPQPVTRTSVFAGKALAAFVLTTLTMAAYYGVVAAATGVVKGTVPVEVGYSFLLAVLYGSSALGLAFFLSSGLRGTTMSSILTFAFLFFILPVADTILSVAGVRPVGNLSFAAGTITNMLSGPYPEGYPGDSVFPGGPGGPTFTVYSPAVPLSVLVMAIWAAAGFVLAWALFRRREMKG